MYERVASPDLLAKLIRNWPQVLNERHLLPENLGILFSYFGRPHGDYKIAFDEFRDRLAATTVARAKAVTQRYSSLPAVRTVSELAQLPTVAKAELIGKPGDFIASNSTFSFATFTSGTSGGAPLLIERSAEEQLYLSRFAAVAFNLKSRTSTATNLRLGLNVATINHGSVIELPGDTYMFPVDLRERTGFPRAAWLLAQRFQLAGHEDTISVISSSFRKLLLLSIYMRENGMKLKAGQIKQISTYGGHVPARQRAMVEEFFSCAITDVWSMSEFFGGGVFCSTCKGFHFSPTLIAELVDSPRCDAGAFTYGQLVVTPLYPFAQRFVLIRYETGDYFQKIASRCDEDQYCYRYLGRVRDCLKISDDLPRLSSVDIWETLDQHPDFQRTNTVPLSGLLDSAVGNAPLFTVEVGAGGRVVLTAFVTYDPHAYPERTKQLRLTVLKDFIARLPVATKTAMSSGSVTLEMKLERARGGAADVNYQIM